jgi:hypothetical protein
MSTPKMNLRNTTQVLLAALLITGFVTGCSDPEIKTVPVTVNGTINVADGVSSDGAVHIVLYHAWALEGELRHPVEFIQEFEGAVGEFSVDVDYPVDKGEGLLVYAWIDFDGDGVLCTPTGRGDLSGLAIAEDFPGDDVTVDVWLVAPCAGPDWFYPVATS